MPGHDRGTDELIKFIRSLPGWTVELTKKNHHKIKNPQGQMVNLGGTPGDVRSRKNNEAALRRLGAPIPTKAQKGKGGAKRKPRRVNPQ